MKPVNVSLFKEIGSTNEQVKKALRENQPEGFVCRARKQTGGYGRQGRLWTSPEGGMYQSLLLRPSANLSDYPTISLVMALSIRSVLLKMSAMPSQAISVKWPNDLMIHDEKIAGISMEASNGGVCLGVGVNVFRPKAEENLLADDKYTPAFFADLAIGFTEVGDIEFGDGSAFANRDEAIDAIGDAILEEFWPRYEKWNKDGFAPFIDEYEECSYLRGKRVRMQILSGDAIVEGIVVGVDHETLCLLVDDGSKIVSVNSGEAHILK